MGGSGGSADRRMSRYRHRPTIAVTGSRGRGHAMWWMNRLQLALAGARAVRLVPPGDLNPGGGPLRPEEVLPASHRAFDGVLIGGGDDIDMTLYGHHLEPAVKIDPVRDEMELALISRAETAALPVLGVCRGAQIINVALGGTLHPELHDVFRGAPRRRTVLPFKHIRIDRDSRLFRLLGVDRLKVNALHHQAIDRLGAGLRAVAWDEYGIVQAIEGTDDGHFLFGVQWHPEYMIWDRHQRRLYRALVRAACRAAQAKETQ